MAGLSLAALARQFSGCPVQLYCVGLEPSWRFSYSHVWCLGLGRFKHLGAGTGSSGLSLSVWSSHMFSPAWWLQGSQTSCCMVTWRCKGAFPREKASGSYVTLYQQALTHLHWTRYRSSQKGPPSFKGWWHSRPSYWSSISSRIACGMENLWHQSVGNRVYYRVLSAIAT